MIFNLLSPQLQRRIDHAFDATIQGLEEQELGGGFIIDGQASQVSQQIPLSSIPLALQRLDLPPDDEQILSVFRNAASGWTSSSNDVFNGNPGKGVVSRDDWRSVCAVLFEHHEQEYADDSEIGPMDIDAQHESGGEMESDIDDQPFASGNTDDGSDDEYIDSPAVLSSRRRTRAQTQNKSVSFSQHSSPSPPAKLSPQQQQTCLETFALFFPSVPPPEVANQKIVMKDIQRVSKLLGEKIKANEVRFIFPSFRVCSPICSVDDRDAGDVFDFSGQIRRPCRF